MRRLTRSRRKATPTWGRFARRLAFIGLAGVLAIAAPVWLWRSGAAGTALDLVGRSLIGATGQLGLKVRSVLVEGRVETRREKILAALDVRLETPLLRFDPGAAKRRVEALGWVRAAVVERRWPGTVLVRITERRPFAVWQNHGRFTVVGRDGQPIPGADPRRFEDLLHVVGAGAGAKAPRLIEMLDSQPALRARVVVAVLVSGRRWNLRFDNRVDVRLPAVDAGAAWSRLARLQSEHKILERDLVAIDLRQPDRLIVKLSPRGEEQSRLRPGTEPRPTPAPNDA